VKYKDLTNSKLLVNIVNATQDTAGKYQCDVTYSDEKNVKYTLKTMLKDLNHTNIVKTLCYLLSQYYLQFQHIF